MCKGVGVEKIEFAPKTNGLTRTGQRLKTFFQEMMASTHSGQITIVTQWFDAFAGAGQFALLNLSF
jgi:hypothetical protein